jgi:polyisoprenoid-binding protein YceI
MAMTDTPASTETSATRDYHGIPIPVPGDYVLDTAHTTLEFVARHLMITKVRGRFTKFDGSVQIADDPEKSSIDISVDTDSIDTSEPNRDTHLRSADFLETDKFPKMTFHSTSIEHREDTNWKLTGDLAIHGVTKPIEFDVEFLGVTVSPWGTRPFGFEATSEIDREDWGLEWNQALETGGVVVGKKVKIEINAELLPKA